MSDTSCKVRPARVDNADTVAELAAGLAWSFSFSVESFRQNYPALLTSGDACLLSADDGRALMDGFEEWAAQRDCALVALAARRAAPFYRALGYEESAVYFRKLLQQPPGGPAPSAPDVRNVSG